MNASLGGLETFRNLNLHDRISHGCGGQTPRPLGANQLVTRKGRGSLNVGDVRELVNPKQHNEAGLKYKNSMRQRQQHQPRIENKRERSCGRRERHGSRGSSSPSTNSLSPSEKSSSSLSPLSSPSSSKSSLTEPARSSNASVHKSTPTRVARPIQVARPTQVARSTNSQFYWQRFSLESAVRQVAENDEVEPSCRAPLLQWKDRPFKTPLKNLFQDRRQFEDSSDDQTEVSPMSLGNLHI